MKDELNSLAKRSIDDLNKYTYFLMALSGGAIAYTINNISISESSSISTKLFFMSVAAWSVSFIYGNLHIQLLKKYHIKNANCLLNNLSGSDMLVRLQPIEGKLLSYSKLQFRLFIFACCSYFSIFLFNNITL